MENEVRFLYLDDIIPNRFQPRENFDEQALKELAVSIKEHGVIQPIVVRQIGDKYEIIAGERRYKASTMAGLTKIPAIIKNLDDKESSKVALIENLQRKDLTPIEEARTYQKILELDALTQEELARTMGKSQSAVSNKLRLLSLTDEVQDALLHEQISERHARSLLNVTDKQQQVDLLKKVINTRMTVRELDQAIKELNGDTTTEESNGGRVLINENINKEEPIINIQQKEDNIQEIIDPTIVDINKIKNEAIDISEINKQPLDMSNLLNPIVNKEESPEIKETNIEVLDSAQENTEDIIGGSGLLAGMTVDSTLLKSRTEEIPKIDISNSLYQNFNEQSIDNTNSNTIVEEIKIDNTIANNTNLVGNLISTNNVTHVSSEESIKIVKETINNIKNNNKNIEMEEFDFEDFYQIVIRIDKK